jgi:hypothetical protein
MPMRLRYEVQALPRGRVALSCGNQNFGRFNFLTTRDPKGAASTSGEEATTTNGTDRGVSTGPEPARPEGAKREPRAKSKPPK